MLNNKQFDLWSDKYDNSVEESDNDNKYPFAGYKMILNHIYNIIMEKQKPVVLDIGFGTAILTSKLYQESCTIYGQDFSEKMIEIAKKKMPNACLVQGDFSLGLVDQLKQYQYDFIVATYSLHHLNNTQKVNFINELLSHLNPGGLLLIGDVMFEKKSDMDQCKEEAKDEWDDEEIYFVVEEIKNEFPDMEFEKVSYCSGIITIKR